MSLDSRRKKIALLFVANRSAMRRKLTRTFRPDEADEALQDSFLRLMEKPPPEFTENPAGYFYVTALNSARGQYRHRYGSEKEHVAIDGSLPEPFNLEDEFAEASERAHRRNRVLDAFAKLPERQQDVISMYFDDDLERNAIAQQLQMSPRLVKRELTRAYEQLRSELS